MSEVVEKFVPVLVVRPLRIGDRVRLTAPVEIQKYEMRAGTEGIVTQPCDDLYPVRVFFTKAASACDRDIEGSIALSKLDVLLTSS